MTPEKKILVAFYSMEGNTRHIAEKIAEAIHGVLMEVEPVKGIRSDGFMKFLWGGRQVMMKKKPELKALAKNPDDFDLIFLGTPVWAWRPTPPIRSFCTTYPLSGKKVALFCTYEGGPGKIMEKLKKMIPEAEIIGELDLFAPLKKDKVSSGKKAKQWAEEMVRKMVIRGDR